jgi:hypothetical protein
VNASIWRLEWTLAIRRRRLLLLNVGIPLLLVVPLALGGAPPFHAAAAYAVLFVLFGTFGSAIPLLREGEGGLLGRVLVAGAEPRRLVLERVLAGACMDALQLLPSVALVLGLGRAGWETWALAPPLLLGALLAANVVGVWVAALARSLAEGALFAAVVSLFLLRGSGVFWSAAPGTAAAVAQATLPYGPFHRLLLEGAGGAPGVGSAASALLTTWGGAAALLAAGVVLAGPLTGRIASAPR